MTQVLLAWASQAPCSQGAVCSKSKSGRAAAADAEGSGVGGCCRYISPAKGLRSCSLLFPGELQWGGCRSDVVVLEAAGVMVLAAGDAVVAPDRCLAPFAPF